MTRQREPKTSKRTDEENVKGYRVPKEVGGPFDRNVNRVTREGRQRQRSGSQRISKRDQNTSKRNEDPNRIFQPLMHRTRLLCTGRKFYGLW